MNKSLLPIITILYILLLFTNSLAATDPMIYMIAQDDTSHIGILVPVRILISQNGNSVDSEYINSNQLINIRINNINVSHLKFYQDSLGQREIVPNRNLELLNGETTIYFTTTSTGNNRFTISSNKSLLVNNMPPITFVPPPLQRVFITWCNNPSDVADKPIAMSYKDDSLTIYAWGEDDQGSIWPVAIDWKGTGTYTDSEKLSSNTLSIQVLDSMKFNRGTIIGSYKTLTFETANIQILGDIDRIFILNKSDYSPSVTIEQLPELELQLADTVYWSLGDSLSLIAIGVDDSLSTLFPLRLQWSVFGSQAYNFLPDSTKNNLYSNHLPVNDTSALGNVKVKIIYLSRVGIEIEKTTTIKVINEETDIKRLQPLITNGYTLIIAPTPIKDKGILFVTTKEDIKAQFIVYNLKAEKIHSFSKKIHSNYPNKIEFDFVNLMKPGIYFIEMKIDNQTKVIERFIKID